LQHEYYLRFKHEGERARLISRRQIVDGGAFECLNIWTMAGKSRKNREGEDKYTPASQLS
jgi:hypothetical protein